MREFYTVSEILEGARIAYIRGEWDIPSALAAAGSSSPANLLEAFNLMHKATGADKGKSLRDWRFSRDQVLVMSAFEAAIQMAKASNQP